MKDYDSILSGYGTSISGDPEFLAVLNKGLPWTNPLKIKVSSDEHIIDTTINRGLIMLLQNDMSMDERSRYLASALSSTNSNLDAVKNALIEHLSDTSMHYITETRIEQNNTNVYQIGGGVGTNGANSLKKNTVIYLPINWGPEQIQAKIDATPHELNGKSLIFMFVIPDGYVCDEENRYVLDVEDSPICFANFRNGDLFVMGDFIKKNPYGFPVGSKNSGEEDSVSVAKILASLEKYEDSPENIEDIQSNEKHPEKDSDLLKIIIRGSGLNNQYSVISFNGCNCETFVRNLTIESSIEATNNNISLSNFYDKNLPYSDNVLVYWPLADSFTPVINGSLQDFIISEKQKSSLEKLQQYVKDSDVQLKKIQSIFTTLLNSVKANNLTTLINTTTDRIYALQEDLETKFQTIIDEATAAIGFDGTTDDEISEYAVSLQTIKERIETVISSGNFSTLINTLPELYLTSEEIANGITVNNPVSYFKENTIDQVFKAMDVVINDISVNIMNEMDSATNLSSSEEELSLTKSYPFILFDKIDKPSGIYSPGGTLQAMHLERNAANVDEYVYLKSSSIANKLAPKEGKNTYVFWMKLSKDIISKDDVSLFSLLFGSNELEINTTSIQFEDKFIENYDAIEFLSKLEEQWLLWTVELDWNFNTNIIKPIMTVSYLDKNGTYTEKVFSRSGDTLEIPKQNGDFSLRIGKTANRWSTGYVRNFMIIDASISLKERRSLFKEGFKKKYSFKSIEAQTNIETNIRNGEVFIRIDWML